MQKWRLQPGKMLLVDLEEGRIIADDEIKAQIAKKHPYAKWLKKTQLVLEDLPALQPRKASTNLSLLDRQQCFGYTQEDLQILLEPMAPTGQEALGSMGTDTPISALSDKSKLLYTGFKQNFAQVMNPPIDSIREELVMSLVSFIGPRPNLFDVEGLSGKKRLEVRQPILTNDDLEKIRSIAHVEEQFDTKTLDITCPAEQGAPGMKDRPWRALRARGSRREGRLQHHHPVRPPRRPGSHPDPCPARDGGGPPPPDSQGVAHLGRPRGRDGRSARGASLLLPRRLRRRGDQPLHGFRDADRHEGGDAGEAFRQGDREALHQVDRQRHSQGHVQDGHLDLPASLVARKIFDAVGLKTRFRRLEVSSLGTATRIEGVGLAQIAEETAQRHRDAFGDVPVLRHALDVGGEYLFRIRGEAHAWSPETVATLQHAVRGNSRDKYRAFAKTLNEQSERMLTIRGMFRIKSAQEDGRKPIPLDEVEPAKELVKRFSTGAMSFGSISREAHTTLAIAMNRMGGKSNTGEGGEEADRFKPLPNGDSMRSAIKQVASGRVGVTAEYLVNSDVMQIKMGAGRKARRRWSNCPATRSTQRSPRCAIRRRVSG